MDEKKPSCSPAPLSLAPDDRILIIDQGNTLVKMHLYAAGRKPEFFKYGAGQTDSALARIEQWGVTGALFCSVGTLDIQFVESVRLLVGEGFMTFTQSTPLPFEVVYDKVRSRIGLDRLAAAMGVWHAGATGMSAIVDAGTAITFDLWHSDQGFLGGSISPGINLRLASLHAATSRLPGTEASPAAPLVGDSTMGCMRSGCQWGAAMEIESRLAFLEPKEDVRHAWLTGGDTGLLLPMLAALNPRRQWHVVPDLVPSGLLAVYDYNRRLQRDQFLTN